jgi:hypothetical protein
VVLGGKVGFFNKIKGLFDSKDEPSEESINSEDLTNWVNENTSESLGAIKEDIKANIEDINKQRELVREKLEILETEELKNDKIPVKEMQIMQGNRKAYINMVDIFVGKIAPPEEINFKNISEYCSMFEEQMSDFGKSSAKSFYILSEFFKDNLSSIASHLKDIDKSIRELMTDDYKAIISLKQAIADYKELLELREKTNEKLQLEAENYKKLKMNIDENDIKADKLMNSSEYIEMKRMNEEMQKKTDEIKHAESRIINIFSPIQPAMKKYSKIAVDGQQELNNYLESPADGALMDKEFRIMDILLKMQGAIESDQLELKDAKREKTLEKIKEVNKESLQEFVQQYSLLKDSIGDIEKRLKINRAMIKLEEIKYLNTHLKEKLDKSSAEIDRIKKTIENLKIEDAQKKIEKKSLSVLNVDLTIAE